MHAQSDSGYETQDPYDSQDASEWEEAFWPTNHVTVLEARQNLLTYWVDTSVLGLNGPLPDVMPAQALPNEEKAPATTQLEGNPILRIEADAVAPTSMAPATFETESMVLRSGVTLAEFVDTVYQAEPPPFGAHGRRTQCSRISCGP